MMKNIFLVLFILFVQFSFAQKMPSLKEVVKQYVTKYETSIDAEFYPKFQKRKDGWYVVKARFDNQSVLEDLILFWSVSANAYKEIYYPRPEKTAEEIEKEFTQFYNSYSVGNDEYQFERNKYYGYVRILS
jgi:hypothetical protein